MAERTKAQGGETSGHPGGCNTCMPYGSVPEWLLGFRERACFCGRQYPRARTSKMTSLLFGEPIWGRRAPSTAPGTHSCRQNPSARLRQLSSLSFLLDRILVVKAPRIAISDILQHVPVGCMRPMPASVSVTVPVSAVVGRSRMLLWASIPTGSRLQDRGAPAVPRRMR
jgi:hypothetical protein